MRKGIRPSPTGVIDGFVRQVKRNCDISDAKFWGYYSICGLLMRYRELYRNEHALMPWDSIDHVKISRWIQEREALWRELEDSELQRLVIDGRTYDPFDVNGLNAVVGEADLVYGSGYGAFNKPTFFVAKLDAARDLSDNRVYFCGRELCRDIAATPAMLQGRCIYVRTEMIAQFVWDRFQEVKANQYNVMAEVMFSHYGIFRSDESSPWLFEKMHGLVQDVSEIFAMHEAGEAYEDLYADDWHAILSEGCDKATELFLRGIKDVCADTSPYGPLKEIIDARNMPRLCLFVAFMDGIRREVFPEMRDAYQQFQEAKDWSVIECARVEGYHKAERLQQAVVAIWKEAQDVHAIARYIRDEFPRPGQGKK
jgi:hypothetical protein